MVKAVSHGIVPFWANYIVLCGACQV
jgi:hypothetical protein